MKTRAAVAFEAKKPLEIVELDLEGPKAGEVLVEIMATGICHTDAYTLDGFDSEGIFPSILGHEGAGIVREVGAGVTSVKPGDHVIPLYTPECGKCKTCLSGKSNLCTAIRATQGKGLMPDGTSRFSYKGQTIYHYMGCSTFSNFTVLPEIAVAKIREDAPFKTSCYIGCGVTTGVGAVTNTAKVQPGDNVVVFGLGGIGLNVIQGAKLGKRMDAMGWANGRHALVTGGGTGIGAATARMLAAEGAKVTLLGRRREPLDAVAAECGGTVVTCDITDRAALENAIEDARAANGPLDYVILNAGIADSAPFGRTSRESYDRIIATNLTAVFDGAQLALPDLLQGEDKRLVVVASVAGLGGIALAAPYAASKHGAVGLVRSLALEFAKTNLTVNAVCPAFVDTPMTDASADRISERTGRSETEARDALANLNPNGRLVTPDEVAASILHLCHPSSRSITGSCLTIDGGVTA